VSREASEEDKRKTLKRMPIALLLYFPAAHFNVKWLPEKFLT
jgi:hypothetical protein